MAPLAWNRTHSRRRRRCRRRVATSTPRDETRLLVETDASARRNDGHRSRSQIPGRNCDVFLHESFQVSVDSSWRLSIDARDLTHHSNASSSTCGRRERAPGVYSCRVRRRLCRLCRRRVRLSKRIFILRRRAERLRDDNVDAGNLRGEGRVRSRAAVSSIPRRARSR